MPRTDRVLRPFWLHQAAEYLVGLVLVYMGLQSLEPTIPVLAGALVLVNAACVDGPLGAFRMFSRRAHRIVDLVVIGLLVAGAAFPGTGIDTTSRVMLAAAAGLLLVVWWNSAYTTKPSKAAAAKAGAAASGAAAAPKTDRSQQLGRGAGRLAGNITKSIRDRQRSD